MLTDGFGELASMTSAARKAVRTSNSLATAIETELRSCRSSVPWCRNMGLRHRLTEAPFALDTGVPDSERAANDEGGSSSSVYAAGQQRRNETRSLAPGGRLLGYLRHSATHSEEQPRKCVFDFLSY